MFCDLVGSTALSEKLDPEELRSLLHLSSFGANIWNPYLKALVAEATVLNGDLDSALEMIETCIEQTTRSGWEERCHLAEILRLKGWMLALKGDLQGAEKYYLGSLDWAREQQAKSMKGRGLCFAWWIRYA